MNTKVEQVETKTKAELKEAKSKMTWEEILQLKSIMCTLIVRKKDKATKPTYRIVANIVPERFELEKYNLSTNEVTSLMLFHNLEKVNINQSEQKRVFTGYIQFKLGYSKEDGSEFRAVTIYFTPNMKLDCYLSGTDLDALNGLISQKVIKSVEWYEIPRNIEFISNQMGIDL